MILLNSVTSSLWKASTTQQLSQQLLFHFSADDIAPPATLLGAASVSFRMFYESAKVFLDGDAAEDADG